MRVPSLGLVEGDIVALMAGDVTPGRVFELLPEESVLKNVLENALGNVPVDNDVYLRKKIMTHFIILMMTSLLLVQNRGLEALK